VVEIDPDYAPAPVERKEVFGITFEQGRNELPHRRDTCWATWVTREQGAAPEVRSGT
jgi:hypothetical protein